jgi:hypothetical protein
MFRIVSERLAWWPVSFAGVGEDGTIVENKIEMRFKILDEDAFPDFLASLTDFVGEKPAAIAAEEKPTAIVARRLLPVVRDWRGVASENGEPLPWSEQNFEALLRVPNVAAAIGRAYIACRNATPEIRAGN